MGHGATCRDATRFPLTLRKKKRIRCVPGGWRKKIKAKMPFGFGRGGVGKKYEGV